MLLGLWTISANAQVVPGIPPAGFLIAGLTLRELKQCENQHNEFQGSMLDFFSRLRAEEYDAMSSDEWSEWKDKLESKKMVDSSSSLTLEQCREIVSSETEVKKLFHDSVKKNNRKSEP